MIFWCLLHQQAAKAQPSLRICFATHEIYIFHITQRNKCNIHSKILNTFYKLHSSQFTIFYVTQLQYSSYYHVFTSSVGGARWLSRVSDLRSQGHWYETHRRHCLMSFTKTLYPLFSTGSTQEDEKSSQHD